MAGHADTVQLEFSSGILAVIRESILPRQLDRTSDSSTSTGKRETEAVGFDSK